MKVQLYTNEQGFKSVDIGEYYPSFSTEKEHYFKIDKVTKICTKLTGSELGIEIHTIQDLENFYLCFDNDFTNFMTVESVEGNVPTSHENLLQLLLNFFQ